MKKLHKVCLIGLLLSGMSWLPNAQAATEQNKASTAILFQGFHWNSANYSYGWYAKLGAKASDLASMGVTHVWFPPPSDAGSTQGYLPRQLNVLDSYYGNEAALTSAISAFSAVGIKSTVDVVINHRVGTTGWGDFTNPTWGCSATVTGDEWTGACGASDTGDGYSAARDLDHTNSTVQADIKTWLSSRLKGVGFTGIRYDFSKGYGASYAGTYADAMNPDFCVGEVWTDFSTSAIDAHRQILVNYVDGNSGKCGVFDFTTKALLNNALANGTYGLLKDSSGKPAGGIGWWAQKMVTFVDNHDTGPAESCSSGQNLWAVPCTAVMQGYAYILTHPGIPTIYYPHVYDWGLRDSIAALTAVRKNMGITSTSAVTINTATTNLYAAYITGTTGNVAMKIGSGSWSPSGTWTLATSGTNYAVWTQSTSTDTTAPTAPTSLVSSSVTSSGLTLSWTASYDAVGVTGYKIFRNGTQVGTSTSTSYSDSGLTASTAYSYTVQGYDAAGNVSAASTALSVTTSAAATDTTAPTAPTSLATTSIGSSSVALSWTASTDAVGVTGYKIYRGTTLLGTSTTTSYTDSTVAAATTYSYTVYAYDAAGNVSAASSALSVTTAAAATTSYTGNYSTMYLRGSMNSWGSTTTALVADHTWAVSVALVSGTTYTYKYEIGGTTTWSTNWGLGSSSTTSTTEGTATKSGSYNIYFTPTSSGTYTFMFDDSKLTYWVVAPASSTSFTGSYSAMYLRGSMNSWGATAMSKYADHLWRTSVSLTAGTTYTYKYEIGGASTWSTNWGLSTSSTTSTTEGSAAASGSYNIYFTPATTGTYTFQFDDSKLTYTIIKQ